jgi:hypothetical protein
MLGRIPWRQILEVSCMVFADDFDFSDGGARPSQRIPVNVNCLGNRRVLQQAGWDQAAMERLRPSPQTATQRQGRGKFFSD